MGVQTAPLFLFTGLSLFPKKTISLLCVPSLKEIPPRVLIFPRQKKVFSPLPLLKPQKSSLCSRKKIILPVDLSAKNPEIPPFLPKKNLLENPIFFPVSLLKKIVFLRGSLLQKKKSPPASFFLLFIWQPYLLNYACDGLFNTESMAANMES